MGTRFSATINEGNMVKVCLTGRCKSIQPTSQNGNPVHCVIQVEMDRGVSHAYSSYDIQLSVPIEFATLLEVGLPAVVTLEQNGG
ncbi:MAG: hypothetical protein WA581_01385 [Candidatus Acidiferrales bacterium]